MGDSLLCVDVAPEVLGLLGIVARDHSGLAWLPSSWAYLAVFVGKGKSLHETKNLISAAADWEVVHAVLAQDAFLVNDVGGTEGGVVLATAVLNKAAIVTCEASVDVSDQGDLHGTETTLVRSEHRPSLVHECRVSRATDDLAVGVSELLGLVVKLAHFSRADEREVEGVEEENHVLA